MTEAEQKSAARKFAEYWKGKGYEKGQSHSFWLSLLRDVFGIENPEQFVEFESKAHMDHRGFIDIIIPATRVLIEQKSLDVDLRKPIKQSDGILLTPFQQAKKYVTELPYSKHPRWVVTCNFSTFLIYDMEKPGGEPEEILLENLPKEYYRLAFLTDTGNERIKREIEISIAAGEIVGLLYDAFQKEFIDATTGRALKSLNVLCVRLVFCMYADDAGVFGKKGMFHDYISQFETKYMRDGLITLFKIMDTVPEERDPYLNEDLARFPYVNGELFREQDLEIPYFNDEIKTLLLTKASENFDWAEISPTIFGAVFESTLNPETRRSGGMHYTSIENIHKVINPLFLNDLNKEFDEICAISVQRTKIQALNEFQTKLASLSFLDPACGSGNFLTETYISLRRLENQLLSILFGEQIMIGDAANNPIKVSIAQFYGVEINDFAVTVAQTALWIAENQMMKETESIIHMPLDYLPLGSYSNIIEGNALKMNWKDITNKHDKVMTLAKDEQCVNNHYVMGNPPFVGNRYMTPNQRDDILPLFPNNKTMDYVCGWFVKAAEYMADSSVTTAFVATNSITQGEQVPLLWKSLTQKGISINFHEPTFKWASESSGAAAVNCVIIGFSYHKTLPNINPYLVEAPNIFIEARSKPLFDVPHMRKGNQLTDGLNFVIEADEYEEFIKKEPKAKKYIKRLIGADEFINNKPRYCLWLLDITPSELHSMPLVAERVKKVHEWRLASKDQSARRIADTPMLFREMNNPESYIVVPVVSSEKRKYIPIGFMGKDIIASNAVLIIPDAAIYHFGILTSNIHMAWMRAVCGRLEMRYRYSKDIVYNNFPWPNPTEKQKSEIENLAQGILDARDEYPDSNLALMYGETSMLSHTSLLKAHRELDRAVMKLYGFPIKDFNEADCVAALMKMYQGITIQ